MAEPKCVCAECGREYEGIEARLVTEFAVLDYCHPFDATGVTCYMRALNPMLRKP